MPDFPESHRDLLQAQGFGVLATIAPSGHPQLTAVAYLLDDDGVLKISLNETRKKVRNLRNEPRCTLFIIDRDNPFRYLEVRADAELLPDPGKDFAAKAGAKYDSDFTRHDEPGQKRVIVVLHPYRVNAIDMS